jgi:hypothetical protein
MDKNQQPKDNDEGNHCIHYNKNLTILSLTSENHLKFNHTPGGCRFLLRLNSRQDG